MRKKKALNMFDSGILFFGKIHSHAGNRTPAAAVKAPNPNH